MKKGILHFLLFLISIYGNFLLAQQIEYLDGNNIKAGISTGGCLFNAANSNDATDTLSGLFKVPGHLDKSTILSSSFWVSALDTESKLRSIMAMYKSESGWFTGPCSDSYDSQYDNLYKSVFKITKAEIQYHISHYNDTGYQMPMVIGKWPGSGRTANSELQYLAPYEDINNNGVYDPQNGDYPDICGEQAIFFMLNGDRQPHTEISSFKMKIQLNILAYVLDTSTFSSSALDYTVFFNVKLINCSYNTYHNVLFSSFTDFNIGCYNNDRAGCDTSLNSFFAYNENKSDTSCTLNSYQLNKVAQAVTFLDSSLNGYMCLFAQGDTVVPLPTTASVARNYQSAFWADGMPLTIGNSGYGGTIPTNYMFPGDLLIQGEWTDQSSGLVAGDRVGIGTIKLDSLHPFEQKEINLAFTSIFLHQTDTGDEISQLKIDISEMKNVYNTNLRNCSNLYSAIDNDIKQNDQFLIYPIPTTSNLACLSNNPTPKTTLQILSIEGRALTQPIPATQNQTEIDVSSLPAGLYFLVVQDERQRAVKRFVKE